MALKACATSAVSRVPSTGARTRELAGGDRARRRGELLERSHQTRVQHVGAEAREDAQRAQQRSREHGGRGDRRKPRHRHFLRSDGRRKPDRLPGPPRAQQRLAR